MDDPTPRWQIKTKVGDRTVSTIRLPAAYDGLDLGSYETIVINDAATELAERFADHSEDRRYDTLAEAERGHAEAVERLRLTESDQTSDTP